MRISVHLTAAVDTALRSAAQRDGRSISETALRILAQNLLPNRLNSTVSHSAETVLERINAPGTQWHGWTVVDSPAPAGACWAPDLALWYTVPDRKIYAR